jgi:hypothetical protein
MSFDSVRFRASTAGSLVLLALSLSACTGSEDDADKGSEGSGGASATGGAASGGEMSGTGGDGSNLVWQQANLTWYTSYPDPNSEECIEYNGCTWAGYFAGLDGKQTEEWVQENNIAAVHSKDFDMYKLKTLRLRQGDKQIDVKVYDMCADSDCDGCCTENATQNGLNFLIDVESFTKERFGTGDGIVEFACLDC